MNRSWPDDPEAFMAVYMEAWNEGDVGRVCDAYHVPALIYTGGAVQANLDEGARRAYLGTYVESTRGELGAGTRWKCPSVSATPLGRDAVLVTARWVFRRPDGTVLEDYPDTYILVRLGGRWAIFADVIHQEP